MPFNLGPEKIIVVLVFALIFLGPDKLPEAARKIGELVGHARRMTGGLQNELRQAIDDPLQTFTREFTAGEQRAVASGAEPELVAEPSADEPDPVAAITAAPDAPEATVADVEPIAAAVPELTPTSPPAAPAAKPALPSWVFPGAGSGSGEPGFH